MATNLYISTTGSDTNNGSIGSPFRTVQKAFETAYFGTGDYVLNVASGSYGGVNLNATNLTNTNNHWVQIGLNGNTYTCNGDETNGYDPVYYYGYYRLVKNGSNWQFLDLYNTDPDGNPTVIDQTTNNPQYSWLGNWSVIGITHFPDVVNWSSRISISGAGVENTFFGGITGTNRPNFYTEQNSVEGGPNFTLSLSSNAINLGNIVGNGADDSGAGNSNGGPYAGNGANIYLNSCIFGDLSVCGGNSDNSGYGSVGGAGGSVTLINSNGNNVRTQSGNRGNGGGPVSLTNSIVNDIDASCYNGENDNLLVYINGGNISLTSSTARDLYSNGGGSNSGSAGNGGNINLTDSNIRNITSVGGDFSYSQYYLGYGGYGGPINNTNSTISGTIINYNGSPNPDAVNAIINNGGGGYNGYHYGQYLNGDSFTGVSPDYGYDPTGTTNYYFVNGVIGGTGGWSGAHYTNGYVDSFTGVDIDWSNGNTIETSGTVYINGLEAPNGIAGYNGVLYYQRSGPTTGYNRYYYDYGLDPTGTTEYMFAYGSLLTGGDANYGHFTNGIRDNFTGADWDAYSMNTLLLLFNNGNCLGYVNGGYNGCYYNNGTLSEYTGFTSDYGFDISGSTKYFYIGTFYNITGYVDTYGWVINGIQSTWIQASVLDRNQNRISIANHYDLSGTVTSVLFYYNNSPLSGGYRQYHYTDGARDMFTGNDSNYLYDPTGTKQYYFVNGIYGIPVNNSLLTAQKLGLIPTRQKNTIADLTGIKFLITKN